RREERRPDSGCAGLSELVERADELVEPRAEDRGDREEERVPGRRLARVAEQTAHRDRAARTRDAWDERESLREAERDRVPRRELRELTFLGPDTVDDAEEDAEDGERAHRDPQVAQRRVDRVLEEQAADDDRH